jgi:hypothetical protein
VVQAAGFLLVSTMLHSLYIHLSVVVHCYYSR